MHENLNLFRYHDLTQRLAAFSKEDASFLRGDAGVVRIEDGEPVLAATETEHARVGGAFRLLGPRSTSSDAAPSFGVVVDGGASVIVTSQRLIVLALAGASQLGQIDPTREIHVFAFPWDLVDVVQMPARKSLGDRIAGGRTIVIQSLQLLVRLELSPVKRAEIGGRERPVKDIDVLQLLVDAGLRRRIAVSPSEHGRLASIDPARLPVDEDGDFAAWLTDPDATGLPVHLEGRVIETGGTDIEG